MGKRLEQRMVDLIHKLVGSFDGMKKREAALVMAQRTIRDQFCCMSFTRG